MKSKTSRKGKRGQDEAIDNSSTINVNICFQIIMNYD